MKYRLIKTKQPITGEDQFIIQERFLVFWLTLSYIIKSESLGREIIKNLQTPKEIIEV